MVQYWFQVFDLVVVVELDWVGFFQVDQVGFEDIIGFFVEEYMFGIEVIMYLFGGVQLVCQFVNCLENCLVLFFGQVVLGCQLGVQVLLIVQGMGQEDCLVFFVDCLLGEECCLQGGNVQCLVVFDVVEFVGEGWFVQWMVQVVGQVVVLVFQVVGGVVQVEVVDVVLVILFGIWFVYGVQL